MDIRGKVALITGAGSGIGRATAVRLAAEGARIVVADVDIAGAQETVRQVERGGGSAAAVQVDLARTADVVTMVQFAERQFGGFDILHNNAGMNTGDPNYPEAPLEQWQRTLDVNLRAVILGTQLAIPVLRRRGGGCVVHTSSLAAFIGWGPDPIYAATKAALVLFTHSLRHLAEAGVRVNFICPSGVNTPLLAQARRSATAKPPADMPVLEPADVADGVVQLIRDDALAGRALVIGPGLRDFAPLPPLPLP